MPQCPRCKIFLKKDKCGECGLSRHDKMGTKFGLAAIAAEDPFQGWSSSPPRRVSGHKRPDKKAA